MKTSNILITIFIGCITLYFLAAFAEIRISGKRNTLGLKLENHRLEVKPFRYVSGNNIHIDINFAEQAELSINSEKEKDVSKVEYHMDGDTLVIDGFKNVDGVYSRLKITLPQNSFSEIECSGCNIFIQNGSTDSLTLKLDKSQVNNSWDNQKSYFKMLRIIGSDSYIMMRTVHADNLDVLLDNSRVNVYGQMNLLTGSISNKSTLDVNEVLNFNFQKDATSILNHRK